MQFLSPLIISGAVACSFALLPATAHAQVVINELMQSNIDLVMDDQNEFPDSWVEIYNGSGQAIQLGDYSLGVSDDASAAWRLPAQQLEAGGYALIYCDKAGPDLYGTNTRQGRHTDFRLDSGKGAQVFLFRGTEVIDQVIGLKKQPAPNISYGRETDGSAAWGYQLSPTPAASNSGRICTRDRMLGEPLFSHEGRVITDGQPLRLELSLPTDAPDGTEIRVTYDGSEPTTQSPRYSHWVNITSNLVVRAKLFHPDYLSPRSTCHSYIFHAREMTLPIVSVSSRKTYFEDDKTGILVDGKYSSSRKNYEYNWRRPIQFEYFDQANEPALLNQLCETRVAGGASRGNKLKSLIVYAHKRFGEKRLAHEFFPDQRPGDTEFKSIMLRNAGNDFDYLYMRDAIIQRTMAQHQDLDWQAWRPVIFYLNGVYKGILNIRERANEDNIYTHYDGLEDIDLIENWSELKEGTWDNWNDFTAFYAQQGHSWAEYEERMDCHEFLNLMLMNLFFNNQDFPGNNIIAWRPRTGDGGTGLDRGRWRFVAKDTDFGLGLYDHPADYKTLQWIYNPSFDPNRDWANKYEHTRLFRRLMEDETFKREFIDRAAIYMGDFMNYARVWEMWEEMYERIRVEYPIHRALYNRWWPNYGDELSKAQNWLRQRVPNFYSQLSEFYGLSTPTTLSIGQGTNAEGHSLLSIAFNGVRLSRGSFEGMFFPGRTVSLTAEAEDGQSISGWKISQTNTDGSQTTRHIAGETCVLTMPTCRQLTIEAETETTSGISSAPSETAHPVEYYDLHGIRRQSLRPGQNIVVMSDGSVRKVWF